MVRLFALTLVGLWLGLSACATSPLANPAPGSTQGESQPGAQAGTPWAVPLSEWGALRFSFTDPVTRTTHRIEGPYRVLRASPGSVELESLESVSFDSRRVLLFQRGGALWALTRIDGREFLTRVN